MAVSTVFATLAAIGITVAGCSSGGAGGSGAPESRCVPVETRALAWSERSPLGFSADGLLRALGTERDARLVRADGTSTGLSLALERVSTGSVSFQEREPAAGGADAGTPCSDVISIPARLSFSTSDAAFDETWPVELVTDSAQHAAGVAQFDLMALDGEYTVSGVDPSAYDEVIGLLELQLGVSSWAGELTGEARTNSASEARRFDIGSFR